MEGKCGGSIMGGEIRTSSAVARQVVETVTCSIMPRLPSRLGFGPWARGSRTFLKASDTHSIGCTPAAAVPFSVVGRGL